MKTEKEILNDIRIFNYDYYELTRELYNSMGSYYDEHRAMSDYKNGRLEVCSSSKYGDFIWYQSPTGDYDEVSCAIRLSDGHISKDNEEIRRWL